MSGTKFFQNIENYVDKASQHLKYSKGLIEQIKVCNAVYKINFPVKIGNEIQVIEAGTKLVQFIHVPIYLTEPEEVIKEEFDEDAQYWGTRGNNGFGSTN